VGRVVDPQGKPLAGVTVQIGTLATHTDISGTYTLEQLRSARWAVTLSHPSYGEQQAKVWLHDQLTTAQDAVLTPPVIPKLQTQVGLIAVGSLPHTQLLAQRLAEDLVRLKGFPLVAPLVYLPPGQLTPVARQLQRPIPEILDRDRQNPQLVSDFFKYLGVKALVVARTDTLIQPDSRSTDSRLKTRSRLELWKFKNGMLQIQMLAEEQREEKADSKLNQAEAEALLAVQITQVAQMISERWQTKSPLQDYVGDLGAAPTQVNSTTVEILKP
jgi:hypothetical protein